MRVCVTGQQFLAGQVAIQVGHCPSTGRYYEPCKPRQLPLLKQTCKQFTATFASTKFKMQGLSLLGPDLSRVE